jgi:hypothetical protein
MIFAAPSENGRLKSLKWICDCGIDENCHFKEGLYNVQDIHQDTTTGNGTRMPATKDDSPKGHHQVNERF